MYYRSWESSKWFPLIKKYERKSDKLRYKTWADAKIQAGSLNGKEALDPAIAFLQKYLFYLEYSCVNLPFLTAFKIWTLSVLYLLCSTQHFLSDWEATKIPLKLRCKPYSVIEDTKKGRKIITMEYDLANSIDADINQLLNCTDLKRIYSKKCCYCSHYLLN